MVEAVLEAYSEQWGQSWRLGVSRPPDRGVGPWGLLGVRGVFMKYYYIL